MLEIIIIIINTTLKKMVKYDTLRLPNRKQILELMAGRFTSLQKLLFPGIEKQKLSVRYMAKVLNCKQHSLRKMIAALHDED